jgi:hypothetical protein
MGEGVLPGGQPRGYSPPEDTSGGHLGFHPGGHPGGHPDGHFGGNRFVHICDDITTPRHIAKRRVSTPRPAAKHGVFTKI